MSERREIDLPIPPEATRQRVDRFVADRTGLSRTFVQRLIGGGHLTLDGVVVRASSSLQAGGVLHLEVPAVAEASLEAEDIPLSVVYEDDDLIVIDKPAGLVVHPAPGHASGTLVNALLHHVEELPGIAGVARPGLVHRLDKDTSGLLVVAKGDLAQSSLMAQLKARRVKKTYLALVQGSVAAEVGRIEAPIGRDPGERRRMAVVAGGRAATTGYRVRERFSGWTLLELDLVTGRTHQIRVHLTEIGHPIAGDPTYGNGTSRRGPAGTTRLFLHAWRIAFAHPRDGRLMRFEAELPPDLRAPLDALRLASSRTEG
jgi:23S rRNA pseudouridine1911/1915/1917 synthase